MIDLAALRKELADGLRAVRPGWTVLDHVPATADERTIYIGWPDSIGITTSLGLATVILPITVVAGKLDEETAQRALDEQLGTTAASIYAQLDDAAGTNWRGAAQVIGMGNIRAVDAGDFDALAGDVTIQFRVAK